MLEALDEIIIGFLRAIGFFIAILIVILCISIFNKVKSIIEIEKNQNYKITYNQ